MDTLLNKIRIGFIEYNRNDIKCIYISEYIREILNIPHDFDLNDFYDLYKSNIHEDDLKKELKARSDFLLKNISETQNVIRILNNQTKLYSHMKIERTIQNNKYIVILKNIDEINLLEEQLNKYKSELQISNDYRNRFVSNINHEIRTPLNGILGMLSLLQDTTLNSEQIEYFNMIKECSYNLMGIVNDIIDYSKLEIGKISLDKCNFNINNTVSNINNIILNKIDTINVKYTYQIQEDLNEIFTDEKRLTQVLLNIIFNSIKFTKKGYISLKIYKISDYELKQYLPNHDSNKEHIKFDIEDTGVGIDDNLKNTIFDTFFTDNKLENKGVGLGLNISKRIIKLMNGHIWLEFSKKQLGTKISFIIESRNKSDNSNKKSIKDVSVTVISDSIDVSIKISKILSAFNITCSCFKTEYEYCSNMNNFDIIFYNNIEPLSKINIRENYIIKTNLNSKAICNKDIHEITMDTIYFCIQNFTDNSKINGTNIKTTPINSNLKILLAEDVDTNKKVFKNLMNNLGYHNITITSNGLECLNKIKENQYDIVFLDIKMPVMTGDEALVEILKYYKYSDLKKPYIVAITAYIIEKERYLNIGFDNYISKPIDKQILKDIMNSYY